MMRTGRPIDHVVLPSGDLAEAAVFFERLGFQVGKRNRHPWGTENHIVQFDGVFVELIALAPDFMPPAPADDAFPFAGFIADRAGRGDPSAMLVLRSADARADAEVFARSGIGSRRTLDFSRDTRSASGDVKTVAFSLAFAEAALMPDLGFFVCQQHRPENFWNASAQRHSNGVRSLEGLVMVANRPGDQASFLEAFSGAALTVVRPDGLAFPTGDGLVEVITADMFERRFGPMRPTGAADRSPVLAAIRFGMAEPSAMRHTIQAAGVRPVDGGTGWTAAWDGSAGPLLVFEQA